MNGERLFKAVISDLSNDLIKLEDDLERIINSNKSMDSKLFGIKTILTKMSSTEASIAKFIKMFHKNNDITCNCGPNEACEKCNEKNIE